MRLPDGRRFFIAPCGIEHRNDDQHFDSFHDRKRNLYLACGHRRPNDKTKNQRRRGTKDSRRKSVHKTTGFYYDQPSVF